MQNNGSGDQAAFRNFRIKELAPPADGDVKIQAESFTSVNGAKAFTKMGAHNHQTLGNIDPGDWAGYANADIRVATSVRARVVSGGPGGQIQLRTGSPTGPVLGNVDVPHTGGWDSYADVSSPLTGAPSGKASIFLTFTGKGTGLFDVDDMTFVRDRR